MDTISHHDYSGNTRPGTPRQWWPDVQGDVPDNAGEPGQAMVDTAKAIETSPGEQQRQDLNLLYGSMYEGRQLTSLYQYGGQAAISPDGVPSFGGDVTWNVIRSVVQTVASQVSRARPRARFLTTDGNRKQKRKAKGLTKFCDGLFNMARVYETTQQCFLDAGWGDVAGIEVYPDDDRVAVGRVLSNEVMIDANDGIRGQPRSMYRRKFVDKWVALAKFGKWKKEEGKSVPANEVTNALWNAKQATPVQDGTASNLIELYEAWHLRSGRKASDGRHVIAVDGAGGTLVDEEYKRDYFPIILFSIDPAAIGPYGRSPAETLMPIQLAINTLLDKINRAQHLAAVPRVGLPMTAKIAAMPNGVGSVIRFQGNQPPVFWSPQALSPEVYEQLERHYEKAFALYGVNAQIAAGQKEAGVTAAVAIRESLDIQTARFSVLAQRWEQLHMDIARRCVDIARDLYADNPDFVVSAPGTDVLKKIAWKDVNLEEDAYVIQAYPASLLPTTPQGRLDRVTDLVAQGIWTPQRAEAALDDMDPDSHTSRDVAGEEEIERICENMLDDGKYEGPEPTMDLTQALLLGSQYLSEARNAEDVPAKHLDLLYRFLDDVVALQGQIAGPTPPPALGGAGAPGGPSPAPGAPSGAPAPPAAAPPPA
jgi:hypothetical protein